jgi:hypothetical protein
VSALIRGLRAARRQLRPFTQRDLLGFRYLLTTTTGLGGVRRSGPGVTDAYGQPSGTDRDAVQMSARADTPRRRDVLSFLYGQETCLDEEACECDQPLPVTAEAKSPAEGTGGRFASDRWSLTEGPSALFDSRLAVPRPGGSLLKVRGPTITP